ncbi:MAG TPA: hypothetical protein VFQ61_34890, partial [Polyangiaceae bacterium]|nr:hypothetical protein [Polyangiaceae bacterium]
ELTPEALLLWSDSGRVAVLRWELESNEREWLSDRLTHYLETENLAAIGEQRDQVDRAEPD